MINTQTLALAFAGVLQQWLTPDQWQAMRQRNLSTPDYVCASHDFCDANMAMDEAFRSMGIEPLPDIEAGMPDDILAAWNEAWTIAKRDHLTASEGGAA